MSKIWVSQSKEVLQAWLNAIQVPSVLERLTPVGYAADWQLSKTGHLSQKQQEILERIYADKI